FVARHNPWVIVPVAVLFGGFGSAGSLLQRRLDVPDASVLVLQGFAFLLILASEALRGRMFAPSAPAPAPAPVRTEPVDVPHEPAHAPSTSSPRTETTPIRDEPTPV